ncbi:MAG: ABC-2 family transporter protein [Chloroflexi bacterium]|nr:ABC-2 family transporter protein [Chloroflexota bacterium]
MRLFWEFAKVSFQRHLTYRAATVAGLVTNFFFGMLRASILIALYGAREEVAGITLQGAVTYTALTQAVIAYLSMFSWFDIMETVYTGDVAADLLKPMNYFRFWLAKDLGRAGVSFLLRGLIVMLGFALFFDLAWPAGVTQWIALGFTLILSLLLSFSWRFLINLSAFWTPNARGILRFFFVLSWFFSGFLMPLRFFPDWVIRLSYLTPFPHMLNTIVEVYLNLLPGPELAQALLAQVLWLIGLIAAGQIVLRAGVRRLVIVGG